MLNKNLVEQFIKAVLFYDGNRYSQRYRMTDKAGRAGYSDCSSLVQKGLNKIGLNTRPNVAVTTHRMGVEGDSRFRQIDIKNIQRGDLVWYRNDKNGKYFGHVGIYLGNGKVFEAIYAGIGTYSINRIKWQRGYRIVALEQANVKVDIKPFKSKGKVSTNVLNVRARNHVNSIRLGQLKRGAEVQITGKADNWFEIDFNGRKAFVSGAYIDLINKKPVENVPVLINGKEFKRGYILNGITYIHVNGQDRPVRKLFESIGADVAWQDKKVKISM
ncbi:uncharacterized protein YgiM (DUF1202 family) [Peptoniphilus olsenii]|uniref:Uncharacterized protein YgiM (DUF1202 family) n=1 Tax=Peptoniphilus olsenii TaxID=411570 RepID=A0ABV2J7U7_9FIRM